MGYFTSEKGLRQGDFLSPFLFILTMEGFDSLMRVATHNRRIRVFQMGDGPKGTKEISHLLYVYDTIIIVNPKQKR